MTKKLATRESYGQALRDLGRENEKIIVLDADLASTTKTGVFQKEFPDRHINCGIAEANMIGAAAGLATVGWIPFASTFAMFAAGRAYEQIRNSIGYPHLNVKICATHAGISVGEDGASHQCIEDIALMRVIPGMTVICPCDDKSTRAAVKAAAAMKGPVYLRLSRYAPTPVYDNRNCDFVIGRGIELQPGKDVTLIACGIMVGFAMEAAKMLAECGVDAQVLDLHTIKPLDEELILKAAETTGCLVTVEEHSIIGGLGGAVCELLSLKRPTPVLRLGVEDLFGQSGRADRLLHNYGLDAEGIFEKTLKFYRDVKGLADPLLESGEVFVPFV